ncbi:MAG: glycosyltransferase family 2 protein [Candidatus Omnitrophota bacterium]|mgnify:CR=1 FL=1|nr:MAG: glycosyltransferase family 2 protein [Candidatus Omnitrophota bacterium]
MKKISLTCFFPCYNDAGSIASIVVLANKTASEITDDYEIIVIDDCSRDNSRLVLKELKQKFPRLRLIFHEKNKGYGGALKSGFYGATKEFVFYTDGDFQYDVTELKKLVGGLDENTDVVNGYKISRSDPLNRIIIGRTYQYLMKSLFNLKIKDVDCDFRLMRRAIFDKLKLKHDSGVICVEMIRKIQDLGYKFKEVPVSHYHRVYGSSQFFNFRRIFRVAKDLYKLWWSFKRGAK